MIGQEVRRQCRAKFDGKPDVLLACVGGGSNAIGLFHEFVDDADVQLVGVEAAGEGVETSKHAATLTKGSPGVLHGAFSYLLQDEEGQIVDPHSISAGCDLVVKPSTPFYFFFLLHAIYCVPRAGWTTLASGRSTAT